MTKKLDRMERIQFVEDQRRVLMNASAVLSVSAHACTSESVDHDQISDVMLIASRMIDQVAEQLEGLTKI